MKEHDRKGRMQVTRAAGGGASVPDPTRPGGRDPRLQGPMVACPGAPSTRDSVPPRPVSASVCLTGRRAP